MSITCAPGVSNLIEVPVLFKNKILTCKTISSISWMEIPDCDCENISLKAPDGEIVFLLLDADIVSNSSFVARNWDLYCIPG